MAHTNVLLREDIDDLGARGEIVKVKAGYARNYLLPRKLAVEATASNVKQIEQERAALLKKEANERSTAEAQAGQLGALRLNFERRVGEHGLLYGSVTSMDIAEALKERGYEIDRRRITLRDAIKETGEYTVPVRLHRDVTVEIPVVVAGAGGAQTANAGAATQATTPAAEASAPAVEGQGQEDASSAEEGAAGEASTQS
jgi:large subunit ribosomal protein L9